MTVSRQKALRLKLRALPEELKKQIRKPMENAAQSIADLAFHLCPVSSIANLETRPGQLRSTIDWSWGAAFGATFSGKGIDLQPGDLRLSIYAGGPDAPYVAFVEFGTSKMRAEPFFFPAYRTYRKQLRRAAVQAGNKGLKLIAASSTGN